jgi:hypothetical protein
MVSYHSLPPSALIQQLRYVLVLGSIFTGSSHIFALALVTLRYSEIFSIAFDPLFFALHTPYQCKKDEL